MDKTDKITLCIILFLAYGLLAYVSYNAGYNVAKKEIKQKNHLIIRMKDIKKEMVVISDEQNTYDSIHAYGMPKKELTKCKVGDYFFKTRPYCRSNK